MSKIEIRYEENNIGTSITVDGIKLSKVIEISLRCLPCSKTLLTVQRMAVDAKGKPVIFNEQFVNLTEHYAIDSGDVSLEGTKLVAHET